jgi:hypothetical protein
VRSGGALSGYTLSPGSPADTDNDYAIAQTIIRDEDIELTLTGLANTAGIVLAWRTGSPLWQWEKLPDVGGGGSLRVAESGSYIEYNNGTALTALTNNEYVNYWIFATDFFLSSVSTEARFIAVIGQAKHATLASAQAESVLSLALDGFPSAEFAPLWKVTYRTGAGYTSTGKCRIESVERIVGTRLSISSSVSPTSHATLSDLSTSGHPASAITYNGSTGLSSTNVEAALDELDSEKAASSHTHDASDVTSGTIATARLGSGSASSATYLRGDQTWATPAGGGLSLPGYYVDNRWYLLVGGDSYESGVTTYAADTLFWWKIIVMEDISIDGCYIKNWTAPASGKARLGIYAPSATTGLPTSTPVVNPAEIDTSTGATAYKSQTFTPVAVTAGSYWACLVVNASTQFTNLYASAVSLLSIEVGAADSVTVPDRYYTSSHTYAALPDVSAASFSAVTSAAIPYVRWRVQQ